MAQPQTHNLATLRIFGQHVGKYPWVFATVITGILGATGAELLVPIVYKRLFDLLAEERTSVSFDQLFTILLTVFGIQLIAGISYRIVNFAENYGVAKVMSDLLDSSFKYLHGHSYSFFNNSFTGSLVRRATRYAKSFEDINDVVVWNMFPAIITLVVSVGILTNKSMVLGLSILAWSIFYVCINYWFVRYKLKFDVTRVEADTEVSAHLSDTLTNHLNLKLFGGVEKEFTFFGSLTHRWYTAQRTVWNLDAISQAIQTTLMYVLEFGSMGIAIWLWKEGTFSIGDFILLQGYILLIGHQLWGVGRYLHTIYEGLANAGEMTEIFLEGHEITDDPNATELQVTNGQIEFQKVQFGYENEDPIFADFNVTIAQGERVALVGSSGSGKSTLIKLLLRFVDIQAGEILIDGQNIAKVTQQSLREHISLVPQEPSLFHRSIFENIRYAKPGADLEEVMNAAKAAHCHEFISRFPEGYDTLVGERGVKLSGGERQRIAIARAILKNSPILILDEATSSLDSESEQLIQDALATLMEGKTTIVIAHRLSTIMQMDTIYVLDGGKIAESGSHSALLGQEDGIYKKLWEIQAGGFL